MATIKQTELINDLLSKMSDAELSLCKPIINNLLDLGYLPKKHKKNTFAVEFGKYGRVISKMEISQQNGLLFWLRFSASENYSQIFHNAVKKRPEAWIKRNQDWVNHDTQKCCGLCKGNPRFYHHTNDDGNRVDRCGGYTIAVPDITFNDIPEILLLIKKQDEYFTELCG